MAPIQGQSVVTDQALLRIEALDLRPETAEVPEIEWDWPTPPAASAEKQGDPPPSRVSAGLP